jgi:uncharacterized protein (DUF1800 family)
MMAATLSTLDQVDPEDAWQAWEPRPGDLWGRKWAAHLYRRAGFGASREELLEAEGLGPSGTLDLLFSGKPYAAEVQQTLLDVGRVAAERDDGGDQIRGWWLYCILQGGHPLREKMTLFWHNHFATSIVKVQSPALMVRQNCLLRDHALGKFGPMLQAVSRDPAMLVWLDSNSNVKGRPNENYARELMELFSLGVGNYTEKDIREAARAFTGWRIDRSDFAFDARLHDGGTKTVLGHSGAWDGGDVVKIVLEQPAAARFIVRKLYRFLVSEKVEPPQRLLDPLCDSFRKSDYDIGALVRTILASRHFYSDHAFRQRVKGPAEYVLGAVQAVYRRYQENEPEYQSLPQRMLVPRITAMGQELFAPPNVKGWPGGTTWLNTSTVLERDNFAEALAMGTLWTGLPTASTYASASASQAPEHSAANSQATAEPAIDHDPPKAFDSAQLVEELGVCRPDAIVRELLDLYLPGGVRPEAQKRLAAFVAEGDPCGPALARRVRETVYAILTMAESQLA